jgi:DNA invertase Pin-like site-specific DNA recombinase
MVSGNSADCEPYCRKRCGSYAADLEFDWNAGLTSSSASNYSRRRLRRYTKNPSVFGQAAAMCFKGLERASKIYRNQLIIVWYLPIIESGQTDLDQSESDAMKSKRVALYLRVSTSGQTVENQRRELVAVAERHGWNIVAEFVDHAISGSKSRKDRPQFDALLHGVARREFDMVAAWSVDRLGRSLQDLVDFLSNLQSKKVDLYLHQQALDTSTPSGKAMFGMLSVFAEFERAMIVERVNAGLARARAKGTRLGRPPVSSKIVANVKALRATGKHKGIIAIATKLGIGVGTVQRIVNAEAALPA